MDAGGCLQDVGSSLSKCQYLGFTYRNLEPQDPSYQIYRWISVKVVMIMIEISHVCSYDPLRSVPLHAQFIPRFWPRPMARCDIWYQFQRDK